MHNFVKIIELNHNLLNVCLCADKCSRISCAIYFYLFAFFYELIPSSNSLKSAEAAILSLTKC
jgi:hypothetical protein